MNGTMVAWHSGVSSKESDEQLVARARAGDTEAFGILIERHQKVVAGFLISLFHDLDAAEEAAQKAFVKAFSSLAGFQGRSSFRTWVSRIALNVARSELRWASLRRWLSLDASRPTDSRPWEETLRALRTGSDECSALSRRLDLENAMEELAPREREVTALRLEGRALGEIAEILQVSEGTVKSTLFDATRKMRRVMT